MFGYVKVAEDDLKVKEYKRYKKYYCDLCRHIANYSQIARMMLSYDMVFFSLLLEPDATSECTMSKKEIKQNNQTTTSNFPCNFNFTVSNMNRFNQGIDHG